MQLSLFYAIFILCFLAHNFLYLIMQHSHCHSFIPFFCCNQHIVPWWKWPFLQTVWMAVTDTACRWHAFPPRKFQMVLPCTSTDRHTIAVNTESDTVKFWVSPSPSFTHKLTCHFWKSKSTNAEVCLTEWWNLRWSMIYLGFWRHVTLAVHLIWNWNVAVTENVVYLKHPVPSASDFKHCFCSSWANGNPWNSLGIVWGNPPPHKLALYYNMQTEPPSGLIYLTCISQAYLIILSTSLFHVRSFCSRMCGRICKIVGKPDYISVFLNQCTTASWFTTCCTHLTVVHKVWQYHHFLSPALCYCFLLCFCFLDVTYFHILACHFSGQSFPISTFYLLFQILICFLWIAIHH